MPELKTAWVFVEENNIPLGNISLPPESAQKGLVWMKAVIFRNQRNRGILLHTIHRCGNNVVL